MIITCYDCADDRDPDLVKTWLYPCTECAQNFVDNHRATGHHVEVRKETYGDHLMHSRF